MLSKEEYKKQRDIMWRRHLLTQGIGDLITEYFNQFSKEELKELVLQDDSLLDKYIERYLKVKHPNHEEEIQNSLLRMRGGSN